MNIRMQKIGRYHNIELLFPGEDTPFIIQITTTDYRLLKKHLRVKDDFKQYPWVNRYDNEASRQAFKFIK